ncbi:hypothetical protein FNV43_RR13214 [Rhamnella rubrinervis]|uniref:Uncharacterized protein n=1 Tax=Rhamnella rubrinervis TaxID=2594499 RepID=A0A8K0H0R2_9ROSA|nr:hypothetical protein FNV43_RR13214 [Rhamnella rubrinervis]
MAVDLHRGEDLLFRSLFFADNNNNEEEAEAENITLSNPNGSTHQTNDFDVLNSDGIELSTLGSSLASSSEQASSTTETETDEDDDYIAELTRQMAHYMFQEDDKMDKSWELRSNHGTPKWPCHQEPISPPNMPTRDEVMGKLEQLNINNQLSKNPQAQQFQSISPKPSSTPICLEDPSVGFCSSNQAIVDQIRAIQLYKMKHEQVLKQEGSANKESQQQHALFQKKNRAYSANSNGALSCGFSSTPWPNQKVGSGMRAVFLGGSSSTGTGSNGTGVFLPCVVGNSNRNCSTNQNQSRKKRGSSPVLIPAKVLQALKVHFDRVGYQLSDLPEPSSTLTAATLQHDNYRVGRTATAEKCPEKSVIHGRCRP